MKYFKFLLFTILITGTISCKARQTDTLSATGTVHKGIPVAVDGCGPTITINDNEYKLEGFPKDLIKDGLKVKVRYIMGTTFYCGRARNPIQTIKICEVVKVLK